MGATGPTGLAGDIGATGLTGAPDILIASATATFPFATMSSLTTQVVRPLMIVRER